MLRPRKTSGVKASNPTHHPQAHPRARVLHQPLKFQNRRKKAKFAQNYERAMVHEPKFSSWTPLPQGVAPRNSSSPKCPKIYKIYKFRIH